MKISYELIIYWSEEDQAFIVEVPELAGCMADGETYQEAVQNAELVIQDLLASLEKLTRDDKVVPAKLLAAVLAYNAMILASNEEFLRNPPAELRAIQASLAKLVQPTIS